MAMWQHLKDSMVEWSVCERCCVSDAHVDGAFDGSVVASTHLRLIVRICSPYPGIILLHTASVASGVTSLGAGPVPPVVTTRQQPWLSTCVCRRRLKQHRALDGGFIH